MTGNSRSARKRAAARAAARPETAPAKRSVSTERRKRDWSYLGKTGKGSIPLRCKATIKGQRS